MIGLLKMHAAGKTWGEICLQAIRVTFFLQYVVHDQGKDKGGMKERREVNFLVGGKKRGDIQKRGRDVLNFDHEGSILGTPFQSKGSTWMPPTLLSHKAFLSTVCACPVCLNLEPLH